MTRVLVIGAGPAGLSAASAAAARGASVTIIDGSDQLGGQYWRHLPAARPAADEQRLHHGWSRFRTLSNDLRSSASVEIVTEAHVWSIEQRDSGLTVRAMIGPPDGTGRIHRSWTPDALVLATGAHDRTLPFPGWQLPGVFSAGAAQSLAKGERVAIGRRVVVAGAGPFLLPVARSLVQVGAQVAGVYEAARMPSLLGGWLRRPHGLLGAAHKGPEAAGYALNHLRNRIPYRIGHAVVEAHGVDRVEAVTVGRIDRDWRPIPGTQRMVLADAVAVSHGFTPRLELPIAAGCSISGDRFVTVDGAQRTSVAGVFAAGEITGIGGVDAALVEGAIAGHVAGGGSVHDTAIAASVRARRSTTDFASRIESAHGIRAGWADWMNDDTLVCRCEEVPYGRLRTTAAATCSPGLRSLKLTTRAGLGICQGRICGRTVEQLTGAGGASTDRRPIAVPVRIAELAASDPGASTSPNTPVVQKGQS